MDTLACALPVAADLQERGELQAFVRQRYAGWDEAFGKGLLAGERSLEDLADWARREDPAPKPVSGRQGCSRTSTGSDMQTHHRGVRMTGSPIGPSGGVPPRFRAASRRAFGMLHLRLANPVRIARPTVCDWESAPTARPRTHGAGPCASSRARLPGEDRTGPGGSCAAPRSLGRAHRSGADRDRARRGRVARHLGLPGHPLRRAPRWCGRNGRRSLRAIGTGAPISCLGHRRRSTRISLPTTCISRITHRRSRRRADTTRSPTRCARASPTTS